MTAISTLIDAMSESEMRSRLAHYMQNDPSLQPSFMAIEIRQKDSPCKGCHYDIMLVDEAGNQTPIHFSDYNSCLLYVYALLHPQGFQRRKLVADNFQELCQLYSLLFLKKSQKLIKSINTVGIERFLNHYVSSSRRAIRAASPAAGQFLIDRPNAHKGKLLIPFVAENGQVIVDDSLRKSMSNL